MSIPVSISHGPFTTNTLASKKFLIIYTLIIWGSIIPAILEFYFFWKLVEENYFLLLLLFPIQTYLGYTILVLSSIILAKIFLIIINLIHKPKEGIFERNKRNKDYYFWSLRAVVKKWPVWVSKFLPLPFVVKLIYKWFDNDSEFIKLRKNISIGKGSSIKASIILGNYLIIKRVEIKDNVIVGSNSFITPGTQIDKNTIIEAMSITKYNQKLGPNSFYIDNTDIKLDKKSKNLYQKLRNSVFNKNNNRDNAFTHNVKNVSAQGGKFVKNFQCNLLIMALIYFISYSIPTFGILYYSIQFFYPYILQTPNFIHIFNSFPSLLILLITPLIFIVLHIINLFILMCLSKIIYNLIKRKIPVKEGVFHWNEKNKEYNNYFTRSFLLRYVKWKLQRSPFPWLLISGFNFIGNCNFGKNTVIEDSYIAKELLNVGDNVYLGRCLIENHLWDKSLTIKSINIEDNVVISDCCCIAPGSEIENNVFLLPLSVTAKNSKLKSKSLYFGAPLNRVSKIELIKIMNFNTDKLRQI
ncbi:MAG: hypothetical protein ACFE8L_03030 [Candidatus Hodarchaeota archaeon]